MFEKNDIDMLVDLKPTNEELKILKLCNESTKFRDEVNSYSVLYKDLKGKPSPLLSVFNSILCG